MASDPRGNVHVAKLARERAAALAAKHGIDLNSIPLEEDWDAPDCNFQTLPLKRRRFDFHIRLVCLIVGEHFASSGLKIEGARGLGAIRLKFFIRKPETPEAAVKMFTALEELFTIQWERHKETVKAFNPPALKKPHQRSFLSGMYHGTAERMRAEKARAETTRERSDRFSKAIDEGAKCLQAAAAERRPLPPPNPMALAIIPKVTIQHKRKPKPTKQKQPKEQKSQQSPELDKESWAAGYHAGQRVTLFGHRSAGSLFASMFGI
jgi:hypothetical protein